MSLDLYIGNKNYSSWSLRPWLLLKHLCIPFTKHMVSVAGRDYNPALCPIVGNARVPCLHVDGFQIWESLAIAMNLKYKLKGKPTDAIVQRDIDRTIETWAEARTQFAT